jgi:hypothetical protein
MIKSASLFTTEIDDIDLAIKQLKEQLDQKLTLLKNSVGIIQCDTEFIEGGIAKPLYEALGIPIVGGTTTSSATNAGVEKFAVAILVLTSDDVNFVASCTSELKGDCADEVKRSLTETINKISGTQEHSLKLVLIFPPIIEANPGDEYIDAVEAVCGAVPIFGTLYVDDSLTDYDRSASFFNGETSRTNMPYVLIYGDVTPRFSVTVMPKEEGLLDTNAIITKANENIVYEINHKPALKYFEDVGIAKGGTLKVGATFVPTLLTLQGQDEQDLFIRALIQIQPDGSVLFRGRMYEGAKIVIGSNSGVEVTDKSQEAAERMANYNEASAALVFSCIARQLVIAPNMLAELECIRNSLPEHIQFVASYSGGEISPTSIGNDNNAKNRFHNYSLITCLL